MASRVDKHDSNILIMGLLCLQDFIMIIPV